VSTPPLLVRAIRGKAVERPPVWAMRQAGRWDPEFNKLRGGHTFYDFSENVELAAKASLAPRRFGVDAIILFYDITTLPVAMGLPFALLPKVGPAPERPIRSMDDVLRLEELPEPRRFGHVVELLRAVRGELGGELPVIVFAGAPFTVGAYCIGTGKDMTATRRFAAELPKVWSELLERLGRATVHFLAALVREGADVYQLFDSWAGALTPVEYARWALPYHQSIFAAVREIPRILYVKECPHVEAMLASGAEVVSLGSSHDLAGWRRRAPEMVFQGNVDERLLREGTPEQVVEATRRCLEAGGGRRHVVNLSHGVDRDTPVENFVAYVETAREYGARVNAPQT
jgi:uroporphyrinogen decarboxylase